ncbi:MAG TPA: class I SAM-dependent methyltransferase [Burkholderiales bacterium]|nr:class I SAM-dependent methyltransferase [Burkholderiales bacterium]
MTARLRTWLAHPLTRELDIDAPDTTALRRQIIAGKPFLRSIYDEWYRLVRDALPDMEGEVLELGSGAGFMRQYIDDLLTSEIFLTPGVRTVLDATALPFPAASLRAIVMTDVFHHIPRPRAFLSEASRSLKPGGRIVMVEPWVTPWSRLVYRRFHHEPFLPEAPRWEFPASGPLSGANGALPWIIFERDRAAFEREFPFLRISVIRPFMPLAYLVSGGVSMRSLMPGVAYRLWRVLERAAPSRLTAMFAMIVVERSAPANAASAMA